MSYSNHLKAKRLLRGLFRTILLSFLLALPLVASAQSKNESVEAKKGGKRTLVLDRIVAVVNNEVILSTELMIRVAPRAFDLTKISDETERARRQSKLQNQVLEDMISEHLVVQAARTAKLDVGAKEVQAAIDDLKKQNKLDEEQLKEALKMQGYSFAAYRKDMKNQILRMRAVNTLVRPKVSITEDDIRAKYDENARRSSQVSEVKLQHILIAVPSNADSAVLSAARDRAALVLDKAIAGEDFALLAEQYSDDPSTKNTGGNLGWIQRGSIDTETEVIVFSMTKGESRGPIRGKQGFQVFRVDELKDSKQEPFDTQKEKLRGQLYRVELEKQTRIWIDELRKKAHYEIKL